jgi:hypothetical protein
MVCVRTICRITGYRHGLDPKHERQRRYIIHDACGHRVDSSVAGANLSIVSGDNQARALAGQITTFKRYRSQFELPVTDSTGVATLNTRGGNSATLQTAGARSFTITATHAT